MTSRKCVSLQERQLQMKLRHRRRGRSFTVEQQERLRRRIAGTILLRKGFTVEQVAGQLRVNLASLEAWIAGGKPLL